jgi:hypothetical protein
MTDPKAKLLAAREHGEEFRGLAVRANDRGERELYEPSARRLLRFVFIGAVCTENPIRVDDVIESPKLPE